MQHAVNTNHGAAPQPALNNDLPLTFLLDLSSEKAQNNFIIDQQEAQINELKQQVAILQMDRETTLAENNRIVKLNHELYDYCQAQYNQAVIYHENWNSLQKEYDRLQSSTQAAINDCMSLVQKAKKDSG